MKLKHWQGYGTIDAKKVSKIEKNNETILTVSVKGLHECGLVRNDKYDACNWLLKRFDKNVTDYRCIRKMECIERPSYETGADVDECLYVFYYTV